MDVESEEVLKEVLKEQKRLLVLHFWTTWSEPSRHINEALIDLSQNYSQHRFIKIEAEKLSQVSLKYSVTAVPTVLFVKDGEVIDRINGANLPDIFRKIQSLSENIVDVAKPFDNFQKALNLRLTSLISASSCVLFMKGTPEHPRCGFSKQVVSILQDLNADFSSFDVLQDLEVRNGLKEFSNWPTYPQLYVKGEFIGGLDIIKDLNENGELIKLLPKVKPLGERLKILTSQSHIMLFMKGTPDDPKCGFSKAICGILKEIDVQFEAFDILEDEDIRQGLKAYSNWPTYPQLYVNGNFLGGLDIVRELHNTGELVTALEKP